MFFKKARYNAPKIIETIPSPLIISIGIGIRIAPQVNIIIPITFDALARCVILTLETASKGMKKLSHVNTPSLTQKSTNSQVLNLV